MSLRSGKRWNSVWKTGGIPPFLASQSLSPHWSSGSASAVIQRGNSAAADGFFLSSCSRRIFISKKFRLIPRCSASPKIASCRTLSPAAVQLRKLVAGGEIPNTAHACIAVIYFTARIFSAVVPLLTLTARIVHFPTSSLNAVCREISPCPFSVKTLRLYIAAVFPSGRISEI